MFCKDCKHFNPVDKFYPHLGWCGVDFPTWLYKAVKIDEFEVSKTVLVDDSCSFFEAEK